ncbi:hypothetical protein KOAAANKH_01757 [Brevundimonas sp. NIBR10]|uniref:GIN domain-containing protein n=1 Tax=Brevundimonas sp. NIBR10 TaxID=3015997 RepID=UPI0022F17FFF|nr:DUF2807 domain-containing protein [Brevundimonas sp. NIBR10]WGM46883.1 hypothetical protein KOAAANKH_01757 [Brevundimonas sp. NIBR10]
MNFAVVATAASIAALGLIAVAPPASAKEVPEVQVRHAVARMVVIVEDRTDVAVEIEGGTAGLPRPTVTRRGDEIRIDGELGRNAVRNCEGGAGGPGGQPGQTSSVEVRNHGRVQVSAAPLIVVRTPRQVEVSVSDGSAVFGAVGRGATSISLSNSGCGDWTVANTSGELDVSLAGSGDVWAGDAGSLDVSLAGSGRVSAGATRSLEVAIAGSGSVTARQVDGPVDASIAGSGDVVVRGDAGRLDASIAGSGSVIVRGRVASIDSSIMGSGDVRAGSVAGSVSQNSVGSGRVRVGS